MFLRPLIALGIMLSFQVHPARSLAACSLSNTCLGLPIDVSQVGGNFTAPAGCDTCPGHCQQDPGILCDANPICGGANQCLFNTNIFYGKCQCTTPANCSRLGRNCNDDLGCFQTSSDYGTCVDFTHPFGGDGVCTMSYSDFAAGATTITGTNGPDEICLGTMVASATVTVNALGGNDVVAPTGGGMLSTLIINGGDGDDTLTGGPAADTIDGGPGSDVISGGGGNDTLKGGPLATSGPDISGYDVISGGDGNDTITGNGGRDFLMGDAGDDTIVDTTPTGFGAYSAPDGPLGGVLCGGPGDDRIWTTGPRHRCVDAGSGQNLTNTFGGYDCVYQFSVLGSRGTTPDGASDIATMKNCRSPYILFGTLSEFPSKSDCGCD